MKRYVVFIFVLMLALTGCTEKSQNKSDEKQDGKVVQQEEKGEPQGLQEDADQDAKQQPSQQVSQNMQTEKDKQPQKSEAKQTVNPAPSAANAKTQAKKGPLLKVKGSGVKEEMHFTLDELKALKSGLYSADFFALNSWGTKAYFSFEGVKIKTLLESAGIKSSASTITFIAEDGYEQVLTKDAALKEDYIDEQDDTKKYPVMIAWKENGIAYNPSEGAPFRLVIGQKAAGDVNKPSWVSNISEIIVE